jgi:hypothetical protein
MSVMSAPSRFFFFEYLEFQIFGLEMLKQENLCQHSREQTTMKSETFLVPSIFG